MKTNLVMNIVMISLTYYFVSPFSVSSESAHTSVVSTPLTLAEFTKKAVASNPKFQEILIENLYLKYREAADVPPSDLILALNGQYGIFLGDDNLVKNDFDGNITLTQIFAPTGTNISASYAKIGSFSRNVARYQSTLGFEIGQSVIRNALGRTTRLLKEKSKVESQFIRHQTLEAYEDYFAVLMRKYILWYEAFSSLEINRNRFQDYSSFYRRLKSRRRMRVALPEDVKKGYAELLNVEAALLEAETAYKNFYSEIIALGGLDEKVRFRPVIPKLELDLEESLKEHSAFPIEKSRTLKIIKLMEAQNNLKSRIAADDLLPRAEVFLGYNMLGEDAALSNPEHKFYLGLRGDLNFTSRREKALSGIAGLDAQKSKLTKEAAVLNFRLQLDAMHQDIQKEFKLQDIIKTRLKLASDVLKIERNKYLQGRLSFNDLLRSQESFDNNRVAVIEQKARFQRLIIEYKRLSDRLIKKISDKLF